MVGVTFLLGEVVGRFFWSQYKVDYKIVTNLFVDWSKKLDFVQNLMFWQHEPFAEYEHQEKVVALLLIDWLTLHDAENLTF